MFDVDDKEDGTVSVLAEDLVDLYVVALEGVAGGVPPDESLALADLSGGTGTLRIMSNMASW